MIIREVGPALLEDWLRFFDGPGFDDNPDWRNCYCRTFLFEASLDEWDAACARGENREVMRERIARGETTGLLAYDDAGQPVGWCHAGARTGFRRALTRDDDEAVGSIVCFVVARPWRRRGVARRLLRAACDLLAARGLAIAEGYPTRELPPDTVDGEYLAGPLAMYLAEGFEPFRELERITVVRKALS